MKIRIQIRYHMEIQPICMDILLRIGTTWINSLKTKILKMNVNKINVNVFKSPNFIRFLQDQKSFHIMT